MNNCTIAAANSGNPTWQPAWISECYARQITNTAKTILDMPSLNDRRAALAKLTADRAQSIRDQVEAEIKRLWEGRAA